MNVSHRILLHVAIGAALVIAVVAWVTYELVFDVAERRVIEHLETYATERMRREKASFRTAYLRLETVRGLFLFREAQPIPADIQNKWDKLIRRFPDGGWRTDQQFGDPSLWGHRDLNPKPLQMHRMLIALEITRELTPAWVPDFRSATHLILRGDGHIIAHPEMRTAILENEGTLTAQNSGVSAISNLYAMIMIGGEILNQGFEPISEGT